MANRKHNQEVLESLEPGDMIKFRRGVYSHWGIYYGNGLVIHFTEREGGKRSGAIVRREDFWTACDGNVAYKSNTKDRDFEPLPVKKILERAEGLLDQTCDYNLITRNCEHFASWCRYGIGYSEQSQNFVISTTQVAASAVTGTVGGAVVGGPAGAVVGGIAGAAGAAIFGIIMGLVAHYRSQ